MYINGGIAYQDKKSCLCSECDLVDMFHSELVGWYIYYSSLCQNRLHRHLQGITCQQFNIKTLQMIRQTLPPDGSFMPHMEGRHSLYIGVTQIHPPLESVLFLDLSKL